jgi:hypothetical protein
MTYRGSIQNGVVVFEGKVPLSEGTIVEVFQKGYLMGDRVIRPAMVVVSTGGPDARRSGPEE